MSRSKANAASKADAPAPAAQNLGDVETALRRVFELLIEEALRNPELLARVAAALAEAAAAAPSGARGEPSAGQGAAFAQAKSAEAAPAKGAGRAAAEPDDLDGVNPIAIVGEKGAEALRDELRFLRKKEPLLRLAKRYALDVPGAFRSKRLSLPDMIDAVIEACERRVREQELSGG